MCSEPRRMRSHRRTESSWGDYRAAGERETRGPKVRRSHFRCRRPDEISGFGRGAAIHQ
jgi:hypothetical protein